MLRKEKLVVGEIYHVFNKSIANFTIFNNDSEYLRMKNVIRYYQLNNIPLRFSKLVELETVKEAGFNDYFISLAEKEEKLVQVIAYCIMPTHLHLILKQLMEKGISLFIGRALNSYTRYFNNQHNRKGPLWEGRFSNVLVKNDEQLLHLTRYIHLNPTTAYLSDKPENWLMSSYKEYLLEVDNINKICQYDDILEIKQTSYREFVENRISYQRELAKIKHLLLE